MVFNIASAALIWTAYQQNATNIIINRTEYALSLTEIVCIVIGWVFHILTVCTHRKLNVMSMVSISVVEVFNIIYSSFIIEYYHKHTSLPLDIVSMAITIIIFNCLVICFSFCNGLMTNE